MFHADYVLFYSLVIVYFFSYTNLKNDYLKVIVKCLPIIVLCVLLYY